MKTTTFIPKLMTRPQLAEALGLTTRGIDSLTKRRVIPVIKLSGRAVRYSPEAVQRALDNLTVEPLTANPRRRASN